MHPDESGLHVHLQHTLLDGRQEQFPAVGHFDHVHIVGPGLHHVFQGADFRAVLIPHRQSDQISHEILVPPQAHCIAPGHHKGSFPVPLRFLDAVDSLELQDGELLEELYAFDFKNRVRALHSFPGMHFFHGQRHFLQALEAPDVIRGGIHLHFPLQAVGGSNDSHFKKILHTFLPARLSSLSPYSRLQQPLGTPCQLPMIRRISVPVCQCSGTSMFRYVSSLSHDRNRGGTIAWPSPLWGTCAPFCCTSPLNDFYIHVLLLPEGRRLYHRADCLRNPPLLADDLAHV